MTLDQQISLWAAVGQVGAAFLALIALVISVRTSRAQTETSERLAREQAASNERLARDHQALLFEQVGIQRDSDILRWTEQVIDVLADADSFVTEHASAVFDELAEARRRRLQSRLSALIDHGRMYFPNERADAKGAGNPQAYRGFRQVILDALVFSYEALNEAHLAKTEQDAQALCAKLRDFRRQFVSEAQAAINPHRFIALKDMNQLRMARGLPQSKPQIQDRS